MYITLNLLFVYNRSLFNLHKLYNMLGDITVYACFSLLTLFVILSYILLMKKYQFYYG